MDLCTEGIVLGGRVSLREHGLHSECGSDIG